MEYEEILDQIIELRDAVYENIENDQIFKVKPQLDQIMELAQQIHNSAVYPVFRRLLFFFGLFVRCYKLCYAIRISKSST